MAEMKTIEVKVAINHPAALVWKALIHDLEALPSLMPGHFEKIEHVEGVPLAPGSTFEGTYGQDVSHYNSLKARWDEIDHDNFSFKATIVEGGALGKHFAHLCYYVKIVPKDDANTCLMDFTVEYEDIGEHNFHDFIKEEIQKVGMSLESYLSST